ncbi:MAG: hypothetical protein ACRD9L_17640 [Bryobacteraceae bacterium]
MTASGDPIVASGVEILNYRSGAGSGAVGVRLCGLGLLYLAAGGWRKAGGRPLTVVFLLAIAHPAFSAPNIASLTPSLVAPQPVGDSITWTASASDGANPLWYRFSVRPPRGGSYSIFRDYQSTGSFVWTPSQTDGIYQIQVR